MNEMRKLMESIESTYDESVVGKITVDVYKDTDGNYSFVVESDYGHAEPELDDLGKAVEFQAKLVLQETQ